MGRLALNALITPPLDSYLQGLCDNQQGDKYDRESITSLAACSQQGVPVQVWPGFPPTGAHCHRGEQCTGSESRTSAGIRLTGVRHVDFQAPNRSVRTVQCSVCALQRQCWQRRRWASNLHAHHWQTRSGTGWCSLHWQPEWYKEKTVDGARRSSNKCGSEPQPLESSCCRTKIALQ